MPEQPRASIDVNVRVTESRQPNAPSISDQRPIGRSAQAITVGSMIQPLGTTLAYLKADEVSAQMGAGRVEVMAPNISLLLRRLGRLEDRFNGLLRKIPPANRPGVDLGLTSSSTKGERSPIPLYKLGAKPLNPNSLLYQTVNSVIFGKEEPGIHANKSLMEFLSIVKREKKPFSWFGAQTAFFEKNPLWSTLARTAFDIQTKIPKFADIKWGNIIPKSFNRNLETITPKPGQSMGADYLKSFNRMADWLVGGGGAVERRRVTAESVVRNVTSGGMFTKNQLQTTALLRGMKPTPWWRRDVGSQEIDAEMPQGLRRALQVLTPPPIKSVVSTIFKAVKGLSTANPLTLITAGIAVGATANALANRLDASRAQRAQIMGNIAQMGTPNIADRNVAQSAWDAGKLASAMDGIPKMVAIGGGPFNMWNYIGQMLGTNSPKLAFQQKLLEYKMTSQNIAASISGDPAGAEMLLEGWKKNALTVSEGNQLLKGALENESWFNSPLVKMMDMFGRISSWTPPGLMDTWHDPYAPDTPGNMSNYLKGLQSHTWKTWNSNVLQGGAIAKEAATAKAREAIFNNQAKQAESAFRDPQRSLKRRNEMRAQRFLYETIWPKHEQTIGEFWPAWRFART